MDVIESEIDFDLIDAKLKQIAESKEDVVPMALHSERTTDNDWDKLPAEPIPKGVNWKTIVPNQKEQDTLFNWSKYDIKDKPVNADYNEADEFGEEFYEWWDADDKKKEPCDADDNNQDNDDAMSIAELSDTVRDIHQRVDTLSMTVDDLVASVKSTRVEIVGLIKALNKKIMDKFDQLDRASVNTPIMPA